MAAAVLPPGLSADQVLVLLLQLAVLLGVALALGRLANRIGLPAVVGELATGILLGPSLLGWAAPAVWSWLFPPRVEQAHLLDAVAQFAVLLLVGVAGAHLDMRMLGRRRGVIAKVGIGAFAIPLALGVAAGFLVPPALVGPVGERPAFALFLGVVLSVSAIPVIAKTLSDMKLLHRDVGQLTMATAAVNDAGGWFLLSVVSAMVVGTLTAGEVGLALLGLVGFVLVAALVGRHAVRWAITAAGKRGESGPVMAVAVVVVLLGAAAGQALGLEAVFGAFVAGSLLAAGDQRLLAPLRSVTVSVLAPLFLATAGLRVDLGALRDPTVLVTGLVVLLLATAGKFAGAYLGARLGRLGHWEGVAIGAGLNARGAVEIVVASVGLRLGVLTTATYTVVVLIAVATSVMAPPLLRWAMAGVEQNADERLREADHAAEPTHRPPG